MPQRGKGKKPIAKAVPPTTTKTANRVKIEKSYTKNMGDYNSASILLELDVNVNPTPEEMQAVKKTIRIVNDVLDLEMEEQLKGLEV